MSLYALPAALWVRFATEVLGEGIVQDHVTDMLEGHDDPEEWIEIDLDPPQAEENGEDGPAALAMFLGALAARSWNRNFFDQISDNAIKRGARLLIHETCALQQKSDIETCTCDHATRYRQLVFEYEQLVEPYT